MNIGQAGSKQRARLPLLPFVALLTVQLLTLLGSAVLCFACPLFLLEQTGSAAVFGSVSALSYIPNLLLAPVGGMLADRADRRRAIVVLDVLLAVVTFTFLLIHASVSPVIAVAVLLCVFYGVQAMLRPVIQTAAADIVGSEHLERAVAIVSQITMGSNILGPVLGAALYGFLGIASVCAVAAAGFILAGVVAMLLVRVPVAVPAAKRAGGRVSLVRDYAQAAGYLKRAPRLCLVIVLAAAYNLVLAGATIGTPVIVTQHFGLPSTWVGTVEAGMGAGGLVGGVLVGIRPRLFSFSKTPRHIAWSVLGVLPPAIALCMRAGGDATCLVLAVGLTWLMVWDSIASIEIVSHVQQTVPRDNCGKVLALMYMVLGCATPLGQLMYGAAYQTFAPAVVYVGMTVALGLLTALFLLVCGRGVQRA